MWQYSTVTGHVYGDKKYSSNVIGGDFYTRCVKKDQTICVARPPALRAVSYTHLDVYKRQTLHKEHQIN